jgi:hypothetical protein
MKREMGLYDPMKEQTMINEKKRSLNLFDFRSGRVGDYYLLDEYSDASEFGGETEMRMGLMEDPENPGQQTCMNESLIKFSETIGQAGEGKKQLTSH